MLRLNNILNDLGLDSASAGSAIAWAMELYQRGIITQKETGGLDLSWGNYEAIEKLLFMTAKREGFGDVIADSARAVDNGKYPQEALRLPHGGEGPVPVRPARCAHPQGLRARPLGRHARHGPPAQPRHAGNQRPRQRRPGVQDRALRRRRVGASRTATRARNTPSGSARTPSPSATRSACAASTPSCSTPPPCPTSPTSPSR